MKSYFDGTLHYMYTCLLCPNRELILKKVLFYTRGGLSFFFTKKRHHPSKKFKTMKKPPPPPKKLKIHVFFGKFDDFKHQI